MPALISQSTDVRTYDVKVPRRALALDEL